MFGQEPRLQDNSPCDGDLFILRPEVPQTTPTMTHVRPAVMTQTTHWLLHPPSDSVLAVPGLSMAPSFRTTGQPSASSAALPACHPDTSESAVRHTTWSTASHHSNVNRLPRSVGEFAPGAASSPAPLSDAVCALFRA